MLKIRTKLMNVTAIAACLTVITMIASCEKEKEVNVKLLDTETSGEYHMRKFFYDEQNRIMEMWTYSGKEISYKTILTYTGEDLTKYEDVYSDAVYTRYYVKNGNTISWSTSVILINEEEEKRENASFDRILTLNIAGFPEKLEQEILGTYSTIYFTIVNGNLTKSSFVNNGFGNEHLATSEGNCTYGTYRSAYSGCNTPKWFMFLYFLANASHNAMTKSEVESINAMEFEIKSSTTYEYVYDSDRFPTKCTQYTGEFQSITEFKYKN